jgi:hypothetical protein
MHFYLTTWGRQLVLLLGTMTVCFSLIILIYDQTSSLLAK